MRRFAIASILSVGAALGVLAAPSQSVADGIVLDDPVALPAFTLEDHAGAPFSKESLQGRWSLVMIGFTFCPDVCPFTLANLEAVRNELALRIRPDNVPQVVFLSVDPDRDRAVLKDYVGHFHPSFLGATGAREEIDSYVEATDSFYRFVDEGESYTVHHSSAIAVIDPDGALRARLQPPLNPGPIAEFLARLQIAYRREQNG